MIWTYKTTVDLDKPYQPTLWKTIASVGNKKAHGFEIRVVKSGVPVDLAGSTVELSAKRQDGATRYLQGEISDDNAAVAELDAPCYEVEGQLKCTMTISRDDTVFSAACIYLLIDKADGDAIVDPSHTIPSVSELLEQIEAMEAATRAANTATSNANTATANANIATGKANTAASAANTAATNANTAKDAAGAAAGKINNMTVSASALETGQPATAALSTVDGHYHIALGLPKGDTGATPQISVQVQTGAAGSEASVSVSGTAENPVIHLTIPRGDVGNIGALTINGKSPDSSGAVTLEIGDISGLSDAIAGAGGVKTVAGVGPDSAGNVALNAAAVGALKTDGTAADSSKLGGKTWAERLLDIYPIGSIYMSTTSTSPASLFGGTWEPLQNRFLLGASDSVAAGSTGGEYEHTLTYDEMPSHTHSICTTWDNEWNKDWPAWTGYAEFDHKSTTISRAANFTTAEGGGAAHNNMPPYLAVYMWKRVS